MRLLLSTFLLALISVTVNGQVMKFKAVKFVCTRYNNQPMEPPEFKDLKGTPVEFNMDSSILYIYSPKSQVFHFEEKPIGGSEKDSVITYRFNAVDKSGAKCILTQSIYESETAPYLARVVLEYPDKTYLYYLQGQ